VDIVGGNVVTIENYPFQVALLLDDTLWCGGSIMTNNHVLTAAHCVIFATDVLYVRAGSSFWNRGGTLHRVEYNATYSHKENEDLSVLRIADYFIFDETHQPIP
jgi:secreted trypsin-like serine protease